VFIGFGITNFHLLLLTVFEFSCTFHLLLLTVFDARYRKMHYYLYSFPKALSHIFCLNFSIWGSRDINGALALNIRLQIMIFWDVTPYILVNGYKCFGRTQCLHFRDRRKGSVRDSISFMHFILQWRPFECFWFQLRLPAVPSQHLSPLSSHSLPFYPAHWVSTFFLNSGAHPPNCTTSQVRKH
jgi:hypothetical protein